MTELKLIEFPDMLDAKIVTLHGGLYNINNPLHLDRLAHDIYLNNYKVKVGSCFFPRKRSLFSFFESLDPEFKAFFEACNAEFNIITTNIGQIVSIYKINKDIDQINVNTVREIYERTTREIYERTTIGEHSSKLNSALRKTKWGWPNVLWSIPIVGQSLQVISFTTSIPTILFDNTDKLLANIIDSNYELRSRRIATYIAISLCISWVNMLTCTGGALMLTYTGGAMMLICTGRKLRIGRKLGMDIDKELIKNLILRCIGMEIWMRYISPLFRPLNPNISPLFRLLNPIIMVLMPDSFPHLLVFQLLIYINISSYWTLPQRKKHLLNDFFPIGAFRYKPSPLILSIKNEKGFLTTVTAENRLDIPSNHILQGFINIAKHIIPGVASMSDPNTQLEICSKVPMKVNTEEEVLSMVKRIFKNALLDHAGRMQIVIDDTTYDYDIRKKEDFTNLVKNLYQNLAEQNQDHADSIIFMLPNYFEAVPWHYRVKSFEAPSSMIETPEQGEVGQPNMTGLSRGDLPTSERRGGINLEEDEGEEPQHGASATSTGQQDWQQTSEHKVIGQHQRNCLS